MPLYERRSGGEVRERVRAVSRGFEDTRLGLMHQHREQAGGLDGWHRVDETPAAPGPGSDPDPTPTPEPPGTARRNRRG